MTTTTKNKPSKKSNGNKIKSAIKKTVSIKKDHPLQYNNSFMKDDKAQRMTLINLIPFLQTARTVSWFKLFIGQLIYAISESEDGFVGLIEVVNLEHCNQLEALQFHFHSYSFSSVIGIGEKLAEAKQNDKTDKNDTSNTLRNEVIERMKKQIQAEELENKINPAELIGELVNPFAGVCCKVLHSCGGSQPLNGGIEVLQHIMVHFTDHTNRLKLPNDIQESLSDTLLGLQNYLTVIGKYVNPMFDYANLYVIKYNWDNTDLSEREDIFGWYTE